MSGGTILQRPVSNGVQEYGTNKQNYPVSEPIVKIEALAQTSGQAEYIADMPDLPGQLFGAIVTARAPANSIITSIDAIQAMNLLGVVAFYEKSDVPGENTFMPRLGSFQIQEELFCSGRVQYYHQPIGIIVANSQKLAERAAKLVQVTFSAPKQKPILTSKEVLQANAKERIHHQSTIVPKSRGTDVKHVIKGTFDIGLQYHFHMEVQCCNVVPREDGLDLYPSTQWMDLSQIAVAAALNIPTNKIDVRVRRLGGSFGGKITRSAILSTAAALAAYKLNRPVKIWMPFEQNMDVMGKRYPLLVQYEVELNDHGVIQYLEADLYSNFGVGGNEVIDKVLLELFQNVYDISTWSISTYIVNTDIHANCRARAPGTLEGLGAIESIMEHIAYELNLDPIDVKSANIDRSKFSKILDYLDDMQSWGEIAQRKRAVEQFNKNNRWKKKGLSLVPMAWTLDVAAAFSVLVSIFHGDGGVIVSHGGIEMGQGINTKVAQVCAYKFGIPLDKVSVRPSCTFTSPNSYDSGRSLTTEAICYAVIESCDILLARMKPVRDRLNNPSWTELVNQSYRSNILLSATALYSEDSKPGIQEYLIYGVCATEVEVDILTGQKQILRVDIIEDLGESMNPTIDIGQVEGAFVMGIGYYTTEEILFTYEGEIRTNRTWNYKPPGAKDIPIDFRIKFPKNNPNPVGVLKSKDGPTTAENTFLNCLNDYTQYVL